MTDAATDTILLDRVRRVIADDVLPLLQMDGGGVEVIGIDRGIVQVRLHGACSGCPSSIQAVIMGVEHELRRRIPQVEYLEAIP